MKDNLLKNILLGIFIFALILRLFAVFTQEESKRLVRSDAAEYDKLAMNIVSGYGFSYDINGKKILTARRVPIYPLFLAAIYRVFGHNYLVVKIVQAIIGALFCIVIFFITRTIYNDFVGLLASFITAVYKPVVSGFFYYGGPAYLLSEYLYMFLMGLSILTLILFIKREDKRFAVLTGISIGLAILTRPEFILFPIFLFFYLLYLSRFAINTVIKRHFLVYFFIALTLAPWIIRNYIAEGKFVPLSTESGRVLWIGNNSLAKGGWAFPEDYRETLERVKGLPEYEKNKIFFKKGIEELKRNPKRMPKLFIKKILVHWAPFEKGFKIFNPYYAVILLFGAIGILFFRRRSILEDVLLFPFLTTTITAIIGFGDPRYRYPYESFLIIFATLAMNEIFIITKGKLIDYKRKNEDFTLKTL